MLLNSASLDLCSANRANGEVRIVVSALKSLTVRFAPLVKRQTISRRGSLHFRVYKNVGWRNSIPFWNPSLSRNFFIGLHDIFGRCCSLALWGCRVLVFNSLGSGCWLCAERRLRSSRCALMHLYDMFFDIARIQQCAATLWTPDEISGATPGNSHMT